MVNIKNTGVLVLFYLLSGCAYFPPKPAECTGPYRPVNTPVEKNLSPSKPPTDSNAVNEAGQLDKTLQSDEGAVDGK